MPTASPTAPSTASLTATPSASPTTTHDVRSLHEHPPVSPSRVLGRRPQVIAAIAAAFLFLAVSAMIDRGALLLTWDKPIQHAVESRRGDEWNTLFLTASRFGSTIFVLSLGALLAALTWRRCRAVSIALIVATLGRPLIEFVLKDIVERGRPDFGRMVNGVGYSFPSGHVMAAVALWGLVPMVVGLYSSSRRLWWASVALSAGMIATISASRIYLGVHWFSDVVGGLLLGSLFLLGVEWVMQSTHRRVPCSARLSEPVQ
jgi:undecaprenyl-diphosphatase